MRITIGELTNSLIPYSNIMEMSIVNGVPFIRALIKCGSGYTRAYVYIVQTDVHQYSVCDHHDDLGGNRFFPTGNKNVPFIQEKDIVELLYPTKNNIKKGDYTNVRNDLTELTFFDYLYELLYRYSIIHIDSKTLSYPLTSIFQSAKVKRNIESVFSNQKCKYSGTIKGFVHMVIRDGNTFNLGNLKQKEMKEVISKFKSIGITVTAENSIITKAVLEKQK